MARTDNGTALTSNTWTKLFDSTVDGVQPRQMMVKNLSSSANSAEVFAVPNDGETSPGGGTEGYPIAPGEEIPVTAINAAGGGIKELWARSAGATVAHRVSIR